MRLGLILAGACAASLLAVAAAEGARPKKRRAPARRPAQAKPAPAEAQYLNSPGARPRPFSEATRVGGVLYLSGQLGTDETSKLVPGGVRAETRQTLENVRRVLERHGSSLDHVFKCTVMLADISEWGAMNEVYVTFFKPGRMPSRSAFGVNGLALGARVEIECWATGKN
jgi:2-iminobutanoate/2-iminopropanoate deaminase